MAVRQAVAHGGIRWTGAEAPGIDAALPPSDALKTMGAQIPHHHGRGAKVEVRLIVQRAEVPPHRRLDKAEVVVVNIAWQIRVIRGHDRHSQPPREEEAERSGEDG